MKKIVIGGGKMCEKFVMKKNEFFMSSILLKLFCPDYVIHDVII